MMLVMVVREMVGCLSLDVVAALGQEQPAALAAAAVLLLSFRRNVKTVEEQMVLLQGCKYSIDPARCLVPPITIRK